MRCRIETGPRPQEASTIHLHPLEAAQQRKNCSQERAAASVYLQSGRRSALGHAAFGRNLFGCRFMESLLGEQLQSGVQYPFLLGISTGCCRHSQMSFSFGMK